MGEPDIRRAEPVIELREVEPDFVLMLTEVVRAGQGGSLEAAVHCQCKGSVVVSRGRVAWATCQDQSEHLGTVLERLGHATAEQLDAVRTAYARSGSKKLDRLLADAAAILEAVTAGDRRASS